MLKLLSLATILVAAVTANGEEFVSRDILVKPFGTVKEPITIGARFHIKGADEFIRMHTPASKSNKNARNSKKEEAKIAKTSYDNSFIRLAKSYANSPIEFEQLKAVTLAMMLLESGRGNSDLARKHNNFGGLKYRPELSKFAGKVYYGASDGYDYYCRFGSPEDFIEGFWLFLDRHPYKGWRKRAFSERAFLEFIAPIYCPFNKEYVTLVMNLVPEAKTLLAEHKDDRVYLSALSRKEAAR
ncbi:MAG: glucosaminidase domain-containing protein [Helicobacteraceae bacterium]|jgi:hypothetical protein|nr:glucosaminidase domain-containing protein [Helicobacteraceae bacterium]